MTQALFMLRAHQLGIRITDLDYLTVGDVFDMLIESGNDSEEWATKSTQDDINFFFG